MAATEDEEDAIVLGVKRISSWLSGAALVAESIASVNYYAISGKIESFSDNQVKELLGYSQVMIATPRIMQPVVRTSESFGKWMNDVINTRSNHVEKLTREQVALESVRLMMRHAICSDGGFQSIFERVFEYRFFPPPLPPRDKEERKRDKKKIARLIKLLLPTNYALTRMNVGVRCWLLHCIWLIAPRMVARSLHSNASTNNAIVSRFVEWMIGSPYTRVQLCAQFDNHTLIPPLVHIIHHYVDIPDPPTLRAEIVSLI